MSDLERIIIITGGSGGLGFALAKLYLASGDTVIITGRNEEKLKAVQQKLGAPSHLHTYVLDVSDNEQVRRFAAWVRVHFERCDLLYNNAGSAVFKPFMEMSVDEIKETLTANLDGVIYMTRAFLPMMIEANRGQIVNIASLAGQVASAKASVYAASKAAVIRFSEGLRNELYQTGVQITCVLPGPIDTTFLDLADTTGTYRSKVGRFLLKPDNAARIIRRAVETKKDEIALPGRLHLLSIIHQLLPASIKRLLAPLINRK
ncbi:SDR family NAD(P)-dependent oxidoreductase [Brevibacillus ginsengisoli]|uniref:SDR family NAD(P)-dependent oxidoreductase n=1 Tax=Brevibacillus ginsengisoli TaxID=363854 RepID=UPI003CEC4F0E